MREDLSSLIEFEFNKPDDKTETTISSGKFLDTNLYLDSKLCPLQELLKKSGEVIKDYVRRKTNKVL